MATDLPTADMLNRLLRYEPETGKLFWRERTPDLFKEGGRTAEASCVLWNAKWADKEAFTAIIRGHASGGYPIGRILGHTYKAHRVIWCMVYGYWPENVDHIDGDRASNRLCNLREVTLQENNKNKKLRTLSKSGFNGVKFIPRAKKKQWAATIGVGGGKRRWLGSFMTPSEAHDAYSKAASELGYHENHGKDRASEWLQ